MARFIKNHKDYNQLQSINIMSRIDRLTWKFACRSGISASKITLHRDNEGGTLTAFKTVAAALLIAGASLHMAMADTYTWDGGAGTANWSDAANWNPDGLPSSGAGCGGCFDLLIFGNPAGGTLHNGVGWPYELRIEPGSGAYVMDGTQDMVTFGITNNSSSLLTISMRSVTLDMFTTATWDAGSGGLTVSSPLNIDNELTVTGSADTLLSGNQIGSGSITKEGAGTLTMSGSSADYDLRVNAGTVTGGSGDLSVGTLSGTGGRLSIGNNTLRIHQSSSTTYAGNIIGLGGSLEKYGDGTLTLSGSISYSGGTTLNRGTIAVDSDAKLGLSMGGLTFNGGRLQTTATFPTGRTTTLNAGGGAFLVDSSTTLLHGGTISGTGGLIKRGGGILTLTGSNSYSGGTTITAGRLRSGAAGAFVDNTGYTLDGGILELLNNDLTMSTLSGSGGEIILGNGLLRVDQTDDTRYAGAISGAGSLTKSGGGILTLSGGNSYTGGTTVTAGTLQSGSADAFPGNSGYTVNGGTLDLNDQTLSMSSLSGSGGNLTLGSASLTVSQSTDTSYSGDISGAGGFAKAGSGILVLSGANTYSGDTGLLGGILSIASDSNLGDSGGALTFNGGTLQTTADFSTSRSITIDGGNGTLDVSGSTTHTHSGVISGSGALQKNGSGTLILTGTNNYSGGTSVIAGTLQSDTASLQGNITNNASVIFNQGSDGTYAGNMNGSGSLSKTGNGILTLTGSNSYTGNTLVNAGTLQVNGAITSASLVNAAAILSGTGSVGSVTIDSGGILAPGNSPGELTTGTLTLNDTSRLDFELGDPTGSAGVASDLITVNGDLTLDGALTVTALNGFDVGTYRLFNYSGTLTDNTLAIGPLPVSFEAVIDTSIAGQVNLIVSKIPYAINLASDSNGSISCSPNPVPHGSSATCTLSPNSGYHINTVTGCGGTLSGNSFTTGIIISDCTVSASFARIHYTVSASAGEGGSISPASAIVTDGGTVSFTLLPDNGYTAASVVSDCGGSLSGNLFTTDNISGSCSVSVYFEPGFTLELDDGSPPQNAKLGSDGSLAFQVNGGSGQYEVSAGPNDQWLDGELVNLGDGRYSFTPPVSGAFAGSYPITVTDIVSGMSETFWVEVPLQLTFSRITLLNAGERSEANITLRGAAADSFIRLDIRSLDGISLPFDYPLELQSTDDEQAGNPAQGTIRASALEQATTFEVIASAAGYPETRHTLELLPATLLAGQLYDASGAIVGAEVLLAYTADANEALPLEDENGEYYLSITDEAGHFILYAPPLEGEGNYTLILYADGYNPLELAAEVCLLGNGGCDTQLQHPSSSSGAVNESGGGGGGALGPWALLGVLGLCCLSRRRCALEHEKSRSMVKFSIPGLRVAPFRLPGQLSLHSLRRTPCIGRLLGTLIS